jgi:hypothetical protein
MLRIAFGISSILIVWAIMLVAVDISGTQVPGAAITAASVVLGTFIGTVFFRLIQAKKHPGK